MCELAAELFVCRTTELLHKLGDCEECQPAASRYLVRLLRVYKLDSDELIEDSEERRQLRNEIEEKFQKLTTKTRENRVIKCGNYEFFTRETDFDTDLFGCKTWSCAVLFAQLITSSFDFEFNLLIGDMSSLNFESLINGKRCLEIGAGTGLAGIAAKKLLKPKLLVQTDYIESILLNIKNNCTANQVDNRVALLNWEHPDSMVYQGEQLPEKYDLVFGTDICYDVASASLASQTIYKRLESNGKSLVILPKRQNYEKELKAFELESSKLLHVVFKMEIIPSEKNSDVFDKGCEEEFVIFILQHYQPDSCFK